MVIIGCNEAPGFIKNNDSAGADIALVSTNVEAAVVGVHIRVGSHIMCHKVIEGRRHVGDTVKPESEPAFASCKRRS